MQATQPRMRRARHSAVLIATFTLMASALTLVATPPAVVAEEVPTAQALGDQQRVFSAMVDADGTAVARKAFRADTTGRHLVILKWSGDAQLKLFILDSNGDIIAKKGGTTQPKKLWADLEAGTKYKIKVKAVSGRAAVKVFVRAPVWEANDYFNELALWEDLYDELSLEDTLTGTTPWEVNPDDPRYACSSEQRTLSNSADEIVTFGAKSGLLWPGVMLQGDSYNGGINTIAELPIRQRAPATVFLDFAKEDIRREVENPTPSRLASAVGDIIEVAADDGYKPASSSVFESTVTHSSEQFALHLGLSAKYLSSWMKARLDMSRDVTENTVTVYFKETVFSAEMEQPQTPGEFFSDDLTEARVNEQIRLGRLSDTNIPVYVSSVTYGRIFMFSVTSTESVSDIVSAISGVYDSGAFEGGAEAEARFREIVTLENTNMVTYGGTSEAASRAILTGDFREYFTVSPALTQYKPISYTIQDLSSSRTFVGETTDYSVTECRPVREGRVRVTFDGAELIDYDDPDWWSGYELKAFFLEATAFNDDGTPVHDAPESCGMWDEVAGLLTVGCWDPPGDNYTTITSGTRWNPDPEHPFTVEIPFDYDGDPNDPEYLPNTELTLRAGFLDEDGFGGTDDWTRAWDATLVGEEIWADELPDDTSTHSFEMNVNGSWWRVYVIIEVDPVD